VPRPALPSRRQNAAVPALLLLSSLAVHAGVLALLDSTPDALPRVGVPAITVDIVLGDNSAAGLASLPREAAAEAGPMEAERVETPAASAGLPPVGVEVPLHVAVAVDAVAAPAASAAAAEALPPIVAAVSRPPDAAVPEAPPQPQRRTEPEVRPEQAEEPRQRIRAEPVPPAAAGGSGRGGALAGEVRYAGRFAAHLARYKRFPPAARRRGEQGSAVVDVGIDGTGRVTRVRVVRSSGFAGLDRAAEAMLWRASPFPPPPGRRPLQLSVPITYTID